MLNRNWHWPTRSMASKTLASRWQLGQMDAGNWALLKKTKVLKSKRLFSVSKEYSAVENCLRSKGHSACMLHIYPEVHIHAQTLDRQPNRRYYMRQSIMLTGLSLPKFNDALASTHAIEDVFRQQMEDGTMEAWAPSNFQGHPSIDIGNRYFTPRQQAIQYDRQVSFSAVVDPDRILSMAMGNDFIHTEDNEVEYYEARKDARGTKWVMERRCSLTKLTISNRHYDINPKTICVGDIVEVQVSFEAIHMRGNRSKMTIKLRAITVLDKGARDVCKYVLNCGVPTNQCTRTHQLQGPKHALVNYRNWWLWNERVGIMMKVMMTTKGHRMWLGWGLDKFYTFNYNLLKIGVRLTSVAMSN